MAKNSGETLLADLKKGEDKLAWTPAKTVRACRHPRFRLQSARLFSRPMCKSCLLMRGTSVGGNYMIFKITKVNQPEKLDESKRKGLQAEYGSIIAQEDLSAYLSSLRSLQDRYQQGYA